MTAPGSGCAEGTFATPLGEGLPRRSRFDLLPISECGMAQRDALPRGSDHECFPLERYIWREVAHRLRLAPQQKRIVEWILLNHEYSDIELRMDISIATIKKHMERVFRKHRINGREELLTQIIRIVQEIYSESCHSRG